ncbi:hypothetical protein MRX96_008185 [Rhipicephalus microplus]
MGNLIAVVFPPVRSVPWLNINIDSEAGCTQRLARVLHWPTSYVFAPGTLPRDNNLPRPFKKTVATPPSMTSQQGQHTTRTLIPVVFPGVRSVQWPTLKIDSRACCIQRLARVLH